MVGYIPFRVGDKVIKDTTYKDMNFCDRLMIAYKFDFNKDIKSGPTFEEKVMKMNSNDIGISTYSPQTAHIMITEFRKFMAMNATMTLLYTETPTRPPDEFPNLLNYSYKIISKGITYYSSLLHPPVHLDRIWKLLILHSQTYFDFCMELCGGYLDRPEPVTTGIDHLANKKVALSYSKLTSLRIGVKQAPYFDLKMGSQIDEIHGMWKYEVAVDERL